MQFQAWESSFQIEKKERKNDLSQILDHMQFPEV